ncbi:Iq-domain [Thalictrum thalictroides]|uniref:Iq-domain n=1 Tax=Thalictrum thalictroides TaxID=46969 RepID=A0A7J6VXM1_THATH|nr:Iq-domain [Thalictrum thalictroides]
MVRSTPSCFKIITCSSDDNVNEDGFERIESKNSTDKRGWSFRKKSDRHRGLGNVTILEASSPVGSKDNTEATNIDFHRHISPVAEKISAPCTDEVIPLSKVNSKAPDTLVTENSCKIEPITSKESLREIGSLNSAKDTSNVSEIEESFAIIIQTAIRGYLSQKALVKIKNVVKLQAAVRGHLVRSQAVGTLRCVQAIVKMQAIVRARRTQRSLEGSVTALNLAEGFGMEQETKADTSTSCTEKILGNLFARQLLELTPKKKQIHIKCDPLRPDSAWKWLERWMSISSSECVQLQKPESNQKNDEKISSADTTGSGLRTKVSADVISEETDLDARVRQTTINSDNEENLIDEVDSFNFEFRDPKFYFNGGETHQPGFEGTNQTEMPPNVDSKTVLDSIPCEHVADSERLKHPIKRVASEQSETGGKRIITVSRKASNPAFIAAQSKFEELSSPITSSTSTISTNQDVVVLKNESLLSPSDSEMKNTKIIMSENSISHDPNDHAGGLDLDGEHSISSRLDSQDGVELKNESLLSPADSETMTTEMIVSDNSISRDPKLNVGGLELGAELSSSFKFDSQDRSEGGEKENNTEVVEDGISNLNSTEGNPCNFENLDGGYPVFVHSVVNGDCQQLEQSSSDVKSQHDIVIDQSAYSSSPERSPRSHVNVPESNGTPSSEVSVKAKRKESHKSDCQKTKSKSAGKRSPSNPNIDPDTRHSMEKLPKESKNGKRRNSFGSVKTDHADQEPRESNSSSLPSYMQATESARAKAQANNSPRSSPDVQDTDLYLKKRHSLPSAIGKQGSPRMPSSSPLVQQSAKGDNTHPSRDRWQR